MNVLDEGSAKHLQSLHADLQIGFWNTGDLGARGFVVEEPLNANEQTARDAIKRYTDKYLPTKKIGRTTAEFDFQPMFLPRELYKAAGIVVEPSANNNATEPRNRSVEDIERLVRQSGEDADKPNGTNNDKDDENNDEEEPEGEEEDEFEELDDDDYNAEKYFDDGGDDMDGDDGGDEAAY